MAKTNIGSNAPFGGGSKSLVYIGTDVYAYSGMFDMTQGTQTFLDFNTGKGYINALFQCNGGICTINNSCVGGGGTSGFDIKFNGTVVAKMKTQSSEEDSPSTAYQKLIIPPYTNVVVSGVSDTADSSYDTTINVIGTVIDG